MGGRRCNLAHVSQRNYQWLWELRMAFSNDTADPGGRMIDIHCHPLSGVDDGAESFATSVAMCQVAAADGITHLVATPHCNYRYEFQPEVNQKRIEELQAAVGKVPKLLLGCDFNLSYENILL